MTVRTEEDTTELAHLFLNRIVAIEDLVEGIGDWVERLELPRSTPVTGDRSEAFALDPSLEDDIDAIGTHDKELALAIREAIQQKYPAGSKFITECLELFDMYIISDPVLDYLDAYVDTSRSGISEWADSHGYRMPRRGRIPASLLTAYETAMRRMAEEEVKEYAVGYDAHAAVRGTSVSSSADGTPSS